MYRMKVETRFKFNGNIFLSEKILKKVEEKKLFVLAGNHIGNTIPLDLVAGFVQKIEEEAGDTYVTFSLMNTPKGKFLEGVLSVVENPVLHPAAIGTLDENHEKVLDDTYELLYFYFDLDKKDLK